jgi:diaminopropionate ammonia-lyase
MKPHDVILESAKPAELLSACPKYKPTPLLKRSVQNNSIWIKDETDRMGLGAFKALGGVYAVGSIIAKKQDLPIKTDSFFLDEFKSCARTITFVCASAGNHGLAVAAGAQIFGAKARIHLSDTVPEDFALRLKHKNAEVVRSGANYEESIEAAIKDANKSGAIHLADGSWPGYIEPPRLVMEGYTIMAKELREEFEQLNDWPTHVYLQAGVGGFAAAIAFEIRKRWRVQPEILIVEPDAAPCLKESIEYGKIMTVEGPVSDMGRLDCKTPSLIAFEILSSAANDFCLITEEQAHNAVRIAGQMGLATSPSGAAGLAALLANSDKDASSLVFFTEGSVN